MAENAIPALTLVRRDDQKETTPSRIFASAMETCTKELSPGSIIEGLPTSSHIIISPSKFVDLSDDGEDAAKNAERNDRKDTLPTEPKRRKCVPPPKKKSSAPEYIEEPQARGQKARRSGAYLQKLANEYRVTTGANLFLKVSYKNQNGSYRSFCLGDDFRLPDDSKLIDSCEITSTITKSISESIGRIVKPSTSKECSAGTTLSSVFSPHRVVPEAVDRNKCIICKQKELREGLFRYKSEWIGCTEKDCHKWAHADCVGFPGLTPAKIKAMPNYYCPDHIMNGRMHAGFVPEYVEQPTSVTTSSSVTTDSTGPNRAQGRRRGTPRKI